MRKRIVLLLVVWFAAVAAALWAHGGKPHVMGIVQTVDEHHVEVKAEDGKIVTALLTKDTKYFKGKDPASQADLKVGLRIVLHLGEKGQDLIVVEARLGSGKP